MIKLLNILSEIKVNKPTKWKISSFFDEDLEKDWEELREEYGEDVADAIYIVDSLRNGTNYITQMEFEKQVSNNNILWSGTFNELINFLISKGVIEQL